MMSKKWRTRYLRALGAAATAFFLLQLNLDGFEAWFYDMRLRIAPAPAISDIIELVTISNETLKHFQKTPGFAEHTTFVEQLKKSKPFAVVYDFRLPEIKGDLGEQEAFVKSALQLPEFYFFTDELGPQNGTPNLKLSPPFDQLPLFSGYKVSDTKYFAKDGVTRRFLLDFKGNKNLHWYFAQRIRPEISDIANIRGVFEFLGSHQAYIHYQKAGSYPVTSFENIVEGKFDANRFRNKIIFVGQNTTASEKDYSLTPLSKDALAMMSVEVHANILDTLLRNDSPQRIPPWFDALMIFLLAFYTVRVVFTKGPAQGILNLLIVILCLWAFAMVLFWPFGVWIGVAKPMLSIFLCYYFFIPYRLILESRRNWEMMQKNEILSQVEELKTNFISMMSHDLKTPLARIQGLTEVIRRDPTILSSQQQEALDYIHQSNEDLLRFINAILQYGQIESRNIQLHRQAKDINVLIKEITTNHNFLAKLKRIELTSDLEPLFPISVDADLMKQVFSNLLENAIKYSLEDTQVSVRTREDAKSVTIQFIDQGAGISPEELPNIFMKFFRSREVKTSAIKGSGLGLYLARYFVELHGGTLTVQSEYGQGSIFTVSLPMNEVEGPNA